MQKAHKTHVKTTTDIAKKTNKMIVNANINFLRLSSNRLFWCILYEISSLCMVMP